MEFLLDYSKLTSPVNIRGKKVPFASSVEHVGIIRSQEGNLPEIMDRIKSHQGALGAVLHAGGARSHRGNPAASLRLEKTYALPVLLSGLGSLALLQSELDVIDHHVKVTQERLMRLHPKTPQYVVALGCSVCLP